MLKGILSSLCSSAKSELKMFFQHFAIAFWSTVSQAECKFNIALIIIIISFFLNFSPNSTIPLCNNCRHESIEILQFRNTDNILDQCVTFAGKNIIWILPLSVPNSIVGEWHGALSKRKSLVDKLRLFKNTSTWNPCLYFFYIILSIFISKNVLPLMKNFLKIIVFYVARKLL